MLNAMDEECDVELPKANDFSSQSTIQMRAYELILVRVLLFTASNVYGGGGVVAPTPAILHLN